MFCLIHSKELSSGFLRSWGVNRPDRPDPDLFDVCDDFLFLSLILFCVHLGFIFDFNLARLVFAQLIP